MTHRTAAEIRSELDHPIVDADGHLVEVMPMFEEYLRSIAGDAVAERYFATGGWHASPEAKAWSATSADVRRAQRRPAPIWWANPTGALDRATAFLPALLYERLDELGIDFTILYASVGGMVGRFADDEVRVGGSRALNTYLQELTAPYADRMTAAAVIPAHTPQEALDELDHAVGILGAKVVVFPNYVERPIPAFVDDHPRLGREVEWLDLLALDSDHDYDPVWQRCVELGVAVTMHTGSHGIGFRRSTSTFMFNHIGHFAEAGEAAAKAIFFGGVTHRFPTLNFGFLEQGVVRGAALYAALLERWEKRGGPNIHQFDPGRIDWTEFDDLVRKYGTDGHLTERAWQFLHAPNDAHPDELDDFAACGIETAADLHDRFVPRFYFGCEADDRMNSVAFDTELNPRGARLNAMLSSDLSHWDVPDMRAVLPEAFEVVEEGLMTADDFRLFSCDNTIRLHGEMNPHFFDGTVVDEYARGVLLTATPRGLDQA